MSEWSITKLGDVLEITNGYAFKSVNFRSEPEAGCLPVLKIKNVANGDVHINDVQYHHFEEKLSKYTAQKGDILISLTGNHPHAETQVVGAVSKLKMDIRAFVNQRVAKIDTKPNLADKDYIYFALKEEGLSKYLASQSSGSANQANISKADIEDLDIALPPLPEQKTIASVLSSLDDKIDLLHRQNKTLEAMAETLFRQWFIEEAKEDWEIFQLQDLAKLQIGRTPPRKESHWFSDNTNDMKWVSIKDLGAHGIFVTYSSEYLPISTIDHFNIPIIPEGTVMLSFKMTVGRVGIAIENMVSNEAIAQFQIKKRLTSELLYCFLKQFNFDTLGSTSSIVTAVNTALLKGIEIALPEDDLIQEFTEQVKSYFDKVKANQLQIQTLEKLRDTLLPKLMSGEVRVQYQTEEVA
ncbi:TPA: restriction endonuclease subunit S [Acinetobacter baumannii]|uniref:restriction endonuclease subunit S n=1 Tax=Acinetobacter baumannii TaxID=470 RepID=UPI00165F8A9E|nr:restriction endonuclease subunit S [Acinetobacter baumannii]MBD0080594.1 restriction endonuclease subunit S [Acinetobacter baumannii]MBP4313666.1 restriction endonuclease subunit S [Acinetobacter baumannii]MBP4677386.1 restriction endonuclease subunit S [Acinetobacter baumannii]MBP5038786.1 restriction endonuclease subunit S [Acinetobacter baumannii]MCA4088181.1 restriction endonuclease subunit S [Acinetobacter baumannii]